MACAVALLRRWRAALLAVRPGKPAGLHAALQRSQPLVGLMKGVIKEAEALLRDHGTEQATLSVETTEFGMSLPESLSYPLLPQPGSTHSQRISAAQARINLDCSATPSPIQLTTHIRDGRLRLEKTEQALREQKEAAQREMQTVHKHAEEDVDRFARAEREADSVSIHKREGRYENLGQAVSRELAEHKNSIVSDTALLMRELDARQRRRDDQTCGGLREHDVVEAAAKDLNALIVRLQDERDSETARHLERLAEVKRCRRSAWTDLQRQQMQKEEECARTRLLHGVARQDEGLRLERLAQLKRAIQMDLGLERLAQELKLNRDDHLSALGRAELHREVLVEDASRLGERRRKVAADIDSRGREAGEARDELADDVQHRRWRRSEQEASEEERRRSRLQKEDAADLVRRKGEDRSRARLRRRLAQDAVAANGDENRFRCALVELDEIRRLEDSVNSDYSSDAAGSLFSDDNSGIYDSHSHNRVRER